jgi:uncharacterized membrane protein
MELWIKYSLIAAIFLSLKNVISGHLSKKYKYIDYLIYAISISFIGLWIYVVGTGYKPGPIDNNDIIIILFRILIVYTIIDPSIYNAYRTCSDPAKATCMIVAPEIVLTFILSIVLFKSKIERSSIVGTLLIVTGGYLISYK